MQAEGMRDLKAGIEKNRFYVGGRGFLEGKGRVHHIHYYMRWKKIK